MRFSVSFTHTSPPNNRILISVHHRGQIRRSHREFQSMRIYRPTVGLLEKRFEIANTFSKILTRRICFISVDFSTQRSPMGEGGQLLIMFKLSE